MTRRTREIQWFAAGCESTVSLLDAYINERFESANQPPSVVTRRDTVIVALTSFSIVSHVSSKFPTDIQGFLWALSNEDDAKYTVASLHMLDQCIEKHERFSKHGKHFAPFHQPLQQTIHRGDDSGCPLLISIPFLDWGVSGSTPPLRFQVDKREAFSSIRSPAHMLRSLLQHFYRLEDTSRREKEQVFNKHAPWSTDRELDLRVRSWYGRHPTALVVDELWILCIDARHIVTFSSNASWKSRWPPQQLISRISHVSFRANRNACFTAYHKPRTFNALAHSVVCLSGAVGMLHRSFWPDIILCLTDRYADYLSHLVSSHLRRF